MTKYGQMRKIDFNKLNLREDKAWRVIDQYLAERKDKKIPAATRLEAAMFILKRLYPEKQLHEGPGENGEFIFRVEIANESDPARKTGNRISEFIEV